MKELNRAFLIGSVEQEPEVKTTASGGSKLKLGLVVSGNTSAAPDVYRLSIFGQEAEFLGRFAHKGDTLGVECRLQPGRWVDRDGNAHDTLDLVVERVLLLENRSKKIEVVEGV